jgi:glycosyltransferase involved in cell wall biosynthesis
MRIAIVNWSNRRVGGCETYLQEVAPHLRDAGHDLGLVYESDAPAHREPIALPNGTPGWCAAALGHDGLLRAVEEWKPDVLFAHGMLDPLLEARLADAVPGVFFAHTYYGTCVGGPKTFGAPTVRPCTRRFGAPCLALYYPRRCGGLNPLTALREYRRQGRRLRMLPRYRAILTNSEHMRQEYCRHGFPADRVHRVTYLVGGPHDTARAESPAAAERIPDGDAPWELLFLGRMDPLKGGLTLLAALPSAVRQVGRAVQVHFVGDGPERTRWERRAAAVAANTPGLTIGFRGWMERTALDALLPSIHLLALPSLGPEPFGRVGPEMGRYGIPCAAFAVGGIPEWLKDGVNGHAAPGDPPTAPGLADAIARALHDPGTYRRLSAGAREQAHRFSAAQHLAELEPILTQAAHA